MNQSFKSENISTKLGIDLYSGAKIHTLTTDWLLCGKDLDFSPSV